MAWCSSESRNKTKQLFVFPWMCCWLNWPGRVLQNFIPLTKHPAKKKRDTGLNGHNLLDRSQEHPMQISEPLGLPFHTPSLHPFAIKFRFNPNTECHCKLFIKTQSNGQWKTSWFFFFGGNRVGHGRGKDRWRQPRKEGSSIHPYWLSRASQVQSSSITSHCATVKVCCS